jgi:iron complex outermembrane receptor protein
LREEVAFSPQWAGVVGIGGEYSTVRAQVRNRSAAEKFTVIEVDRDFGNVAPEAALLYRPTEDVTAHLRVGTGYGIPGISNLTTASTGLAGNNTDLKAQRNVGVELGIDTRRWLGILDLSLTGYYEWFTDEFVTLSPGAGLSSFTTNAPASEHRGIELSATLWPLAGDPLGRGLYLRTSYTFNDHVYTDFHEVIGGVRFDRSGKLIPGVERHFLNAKLGYESPWHLGGWLEVNYLDDYFVNNSNTLSAPAYHVLNLNLHYARAIGSSFLRGIETFFEVRNLLDATYVESAVTVADDVLNTAASLANKQAFFAGPSRSFYGGVRLRF